MTQPCHTVSLAALTLALSPSLATAALCVESVHPRLDQFITHSYRFTSRSGHSPLSGLSDSDKSLLCSSLDGPFCSLKNPSPATPVAAKGAWFNVQDGIVFAPQFVSCGAHEAASCDECPMGQGKTWCNGDCKWVSGECIRKVKPNKTDVPAVSRTPDDQSADPTTPPVDPSQYDGTASGSVDVPKVSGGASGRSVSCGRHSATSCSECPQGFGEKWCHGECVWMNGKDCLEKLDTDISCGLHRARNCADCPQGNGVTWCHGDCEWHFSKSENEVAEASEAGECKARTRLPKALQIVPDPDQNGKKCGTPLGKMSDRLFVLIGAAATIEACGLECRHDTACVAWSGIAGDWCFGCKAPLEEAHAGALAYKKGNSKTVVCGQHTADDCSACPEGNGPTWCNGECVWLSHNGVGEECIDRTRVRMLDERHWSGLTGNGLVNVTCGEGGSEHKASNCSGCPQDHGAEWCHGDCAWFEDECVAMVRLQKLAQAATKQVSCGGATFHDLVGTEVASTTITGDSTLGLDNTCCEACSSNAECEFWVRESGTEGVKTCWLMMQPQGTPHEMKNRRGGFKADPIAEYTSLGVATWCGGAAATGLHRFESDANTANDCAIKCSARTDCTAFHFKSTDCHLFEHSGVDGVYQHEGTCYKKKKAP